RAEPKAVDVFGELLDIAVGRGLESLLELAQGRRLGGRRSGARLRCSGEPVARRSRERVAVGAIEELRAGAVAGHAAALVHDEPRLEALDIARDGVFGERLQRRETGLVE